MNNPCCQYSGNRNNMGQAEKKGSHLYDSNATEINKSYLNLKKMLY